LAILAGLRYTDARIAGATSPTILPGNRIQLVPLNQFSWWNKYQFTRSGPPPSASSTSIVRFVGVDAGVFAQITANWKAQINVENLFNKGYWASADGNNNLAGSGADISPKATATF
jgi:catecholate siderophore receptor